MLADDGPAWSAGDFAGALEGDMGYGEETLDMEEVLAPTRSRIVLMGRKRSGKTSIQRVVFHKMSPHETLFLEPTHHLDVKHIVNNDFVHFQVWDFSGEYVLENGVTYNEQHIPDADIFRLCTSLVYVLDAQDEELDESLARLGQTVQHAYSINPDINFEVFVHKVDGDLFVSDEQKLEMQNEVQRRVESEMLESVHATDISYYLTSIYDHTVYQAFSKVLQKMIPQLPVLENLLNILVASCTIEKSFLFDVVSKLYLATDSQPVDMQTYEICSDMIDVVIDVSCIYGLKQDMNGDVNGLAYDAASSSVIRLSSGMVLYLREVSSYMALVCLVRSDNFKKRGLIDYNIDCFKKSLDSIFHAQPTTMAEALPSDADQRDATEQSATVTGDA